LRAERASDGCINVICACNRLAFRAPWTLHFGGPMRALSADVSAAMTTEVDMQLAYLRDPRLAAHALSPTPAWLWREDAKQILWANPAGKSIFGAASPGMLAAMRFESDHSAAAQVRRLSGTLPRAEASRLERLRGFGAHTAAVLVCLCSRVTLADNSAAILVISTERAGRDLALPDRARCLLQDLDQPAAMFTADGELIEEQPAAQTLLGRRRDILALGAGKLAREASLNGSAEGRIGAGSIEILKLGAGRTFALLVVFTKSIVCPCVSSREHITGIASSAKPNFPASAVHPHHFPFRFVWQTDADTHFSVANQEFADLLGPNTAGVFGRSWPDIAQALNVDPQGQISNAIGARETFSGIVLLWPVDDVDERLPIEMSGLPVFDRDRQFKGFRGFGICRDLDRLQEIRQRRMPQPSAQTPPPTEAPSKILRFHPTPEPRAEEPKLNPRERSAFQELARELSERLKRTSTAARTPVPDDFGSEPAVPIAQPVREPMKIAADAQDTRPILDRLPVGILIYRLNTLIYANRGFLDWTGYHSLEALNEAGGLDSLFIESKPRTSGKKNAGKSLTIATVSGKQKPVEGRLFSATWNNDSALVLMIDTRAGASDANEKSAEVSSPRTDEENRELRAILDTATDGVLVIDRTGHILSANRSAEALFGYSDLTDRSLGDLLAPESRGSAAEHLDRIAHSTGADVLDAGYEAIGRVRQGGLVPLYITIGRIEGGEKLCAVLRDLTSWKLTAEELTGAKQAAEKASIAKSELIAKISHEIRSPLNAIIGFSEVMMSERFGPIGNERYRQYLKDIHASGGHLISLLNDLVDLSKIEAGKLELTFTSVNLNDLIQQCVAIIQHQANRERVIIRTALSAGLPQVIADARSMRQIALNLLSNSITFTGAGGQVIVSTALTDEQEVVLRVRDTGSGISEKDLQTVLKPFGQTASAVRWTPGGTGLGLSITKALVEANHACLRIASEVGDGTLVEIAFPSTRMLAQ
jgi:PAS domain S-box-containing protein